MREIKEPTGLTYSFKDRIAINGRDERQKKSQSQKQLGRSQDNKPLTKPNTLKNS